MTNTAFYIYTYIYFVNKCLKENSPYIYIYICIVVTISDFIYIQYMYDVGTEIRNCNNKEMSENVFSRESNPGLLDTGQMPYH